MSISACLWKCPLHGATQLYSLRILLINHSTGIVLAKNRCKLAACDQQAEAYQDESKSRLLAAKLVPTRRWKLNLVTAGQTNEVLHASFCCKCTLICCTKQVISITRSSFLLRGFSRNLGQACSSNNMQNTNSDVGHIVAIRFLYRTRSLVVLDIWNSQSQCKELWVSFSENELLPPQCTSVWEFYTRYCYKVQQQFQQSRPALKQVQ